MPKAGSYQTEAIIIKKTRLGEADRILTFYTPDMGKVQGVAKGVRRPKSKLSGHLELLTHSMVMLAQGRGNLDTITGCQTIHSFLLLKSDLDLCACALYSTELVNQFGVDRQENRRLFNLLLAFMTKLSLLDTGIPDRLSRAEVLLRYFEIQLLDAAGYRPRLDLCVACQKPLPDNSPRYFSVSAGGAVCPDCRPKLAFTFSMSQPVLDTMRELQQENQPETGGLNLDAKTSRELELLVRHYLRFILERDLRSAAWLDQLKHNGKAV